MMRLVALGSTSTLAWRFLGSTRQAEKHHGGLGVIKSKVSLRAGEGRKHDFFHAQNDGNDHVSTDWAAVLWARFLSLFDCQKVADSCEVGIGTIYVYIYIYIYVYHRLRKIVSSILTQVWKITLICFF